MRLFRSDMVGARRWFLIVRGRRCVLFLGRHSQRTERLGTGFAVAAGPVAFVTLADR